MSQAGAATNSTPAPTPVPTLSPYIVGTTGTSDFSTIQAAITAAVAAGATGSNPYNIYIKPGTYNENLTISDGINLVGFTGWGDSDQLTTNNSANLKPPVIVTGSLSCSYLALGAASTNQITNIEFNPAAGDVCTLVMNAANSGWIGFNNCILQVNNASSVFVTTNTPRIYLTNTSISDRSGGTATLITSSSNAMGLIFATGSNFTINTTTALDLGNNKSITFNLSQCYWAALVNHSGTGGSYSINAFRSRFESTTAADMFSYPDTNTGGNNLFDCCDIVLPVNRYLVNMVSTNTTATTRLHNCKLGPATTSISTIVTANKYIISDSSSSTTTQNAIQVFKGNQVGYGASISKKAQATFQTTDASNQTIVSLGVPSNQSVVISGRIVGQNAAFTDTTGGDFMAVALNNGGALALVGGPVVNVNATSTGTFTVTTSGTNVIVRLNGIAATTINWVCTYEYEFIATDA